MPRAESGSGSRFFRRLREAGELQRAFVDLEAVTREGAGSDRVAEGEVAPEHVRSGVMDAEGEFALPSADVGDAPGLERRGVVVDAQVDRRTFAEAFAEVDQRYRCYG